VPWPSSYLKFISFFAIANFDFVNWARVGCVVPTNYYTKWTVMILIPPILIVTLIVFFVLPVTYYIRHDMEDDLEKRNRIKSLRRRFGKLAIFTFFLMYPSVSSVVLKLYDCKQVAGTYYLLADFTIECYTKKWSNYALGNIPFLLLYPAGIPLTFFALLYVNRHQLTEPKVRLQLGFLYDGYSIDMWWFEMVDMLHKLLLTGVLAFVPVDAAVPMALVFTICYTIIILVKRPYLRKGDDRLHLLGQTELYLLILSAFVLDHYDRLDDTSDALLSALLIVITIGFFFTFIFQLTRALHKFIHQQWMARLLALNQRVEMEDSSAHEMGDIDNSGIAAKPKDKEPIAPPAGMYIAGVEDDIFIVDGPSPSGSPSAVPSPSESDSQHKFERRGSSSSNLSQVEGAPPSSTPRVELPAWPEVEEDDEVVI